jgi:hypothetical protein
LRKKIGAETIKGDPDAVLTVAPRVRSNKIVEDIKFTTLQVSK